MRSDRDDGMVTAELAVCLPVLVLLLVVALGAVSVAAARIRVADAAREAARLAARGDEAGIARLIREDAPAIKIAISRSAAQVTATATSHAGLIGSALPAVDVSATSVAALEPVGPP
jgi:Flp pilus assembly protein TadG